MSAEDPHVDPDADADPDPDHPDADADPGADPDLAADAAGVAGVDGDVAIRRTIHRQALSIVSAVAPFAVVFGAAAARTGLTFWETVGFSAFVFAGSVQFAAVQILGDGGSVASATVAGLLLGVRSLAFGIILAPVLTGPWWKRLMMSQLVLDESVAVGAVQPTRRWQRYGFLWTGVGVYVVWNLSTIIGFVVFSGAEDLVTDLGLDTAGPAALLALLWPRLSSTPQRRTAIASGVIALALTPFTPAGVPILLAMFGVAAALLPVSVRPPAFGPTEGRSSGRGDRSGGPT